MVVQYHAPVCLHKTDIAVVAPESIAQKMGKIQTAVWLYYVERRLLLARKAFLGTSRLQRNISCESAAWVSTSCYYGQHGQHAV